MPHLIPHLVNPKKGGSSKREMSRIYATERQKLKRSTWSDQVKYAWMVHYMGQLGSGPWSRASVWRDSKFFILESQQNETKGKPNTKSRPHHKETERATKGHKHALSHDFVSSIKCSHGQCQRQSQVVT